MAPGKQTTRFRAALVCAVLWGLATAAQATSSRIDETGTVVSEPVVNMKWRNVAPGRVRENTVEATLRVDVRLNLAPWINQSSRIYMVLAPVTGERVRARWTTQGRLLPGTLYSGERALVYQGPASPATLVESLLLTLETDGERLTQMQTLNFYFEIEVSP
ncbi:MAG: hypothetical protein JWQ13_1157 [Ramlibacter sp.]|jgi:hypothetical protein|nr:hypothetical protein [Ramlibacter sp.]